MQYDGTEEDEARGLGVSFLVAAVIAVPGIFVGASAWLTPGGGAIDAIGVLVGWGALAGSAVGAVAGGIVAAAPRSGGVGCVAGLVTGGLVAAATAAVVVFSFLGG